MKSARIGDLAVDVHWASGCVCTFVGQRLFDELVWTGLGRVVPHSKLNQHDLEGVAQYVGSLTAGHLRGVSFSLGVGNKAMQILAVVVPEFTGRRVVLGSDIVVGRFGWNVSIEMLTPQGSFITLGGMKIPFVPEGIVLFAGVPSIQYFDLAIDVFTDGACSNNGNYDAKGGFACLFPGFPALNVSGDLPGMAQTSNRAEYTAVKAALKAAKRIDSTEHRELRIHTDSQLLIDSMTTYLKVWRSNGWRNSKGEQVANRDLLESIATLMAARNNNVTFVHVKAHTGSQDWASRWNEEADFKARSFCL